jgi:hypothetical protein
MCLINRIEILQQPNVHRAYASAEQRQRNKRALGDWQIQIADSIAPSSLLPQFPMCLLLAFPPIK